MINQMNDFDICHLKIRWWRISMDLRNLITFINVVELGSFTKAAEHLNYSQSTVSFQIKQLEEELGCLLFERINHTISLTEIGKELVLYAHKVTTITEEFKENIEAEKQCSGYIHIVAPDSVCDDIINRNFMDFYKRYPDISVKFTNADTSMMFDLLDHNKADVIITLDNHTFNKDYVIEKEELISMHFVANSTSKFAGVKNLSINDIISEPFILTEYGQGYRRVFDEELAKKSLEITPTLELGRTDMITSIIAQNDMISFLPDFVTKDMINAGQLCYLDVSDFNVEIWKQLIYHKNKWMSKALKAFIDYIKELEF